MLKKWIQQFKAYLENERTREISDKENAETGLVLFLVVIVFAIAGLANHP